jgi:putative DNA primase/helicase
MPTESLTPFATLPLTDVPWLWPGRLPLGQISLLVSRPGVGKSLLTTDLAARISTGAPWPDGSHCPKGSVIFITREDDPSQIILPRLLTHNGNLEKIFLLSVLHDLAKSTANPDAFFDLERYGPLEDALRELTDCKLVIFDPIGAFFPRSDITRDPAIRKSLATLFHFAQRYGPAMLLVHNLRARGQADQRILGGAAFTSISRNIWHLMRDPQNKSRRIFASGKTNFAPESPALAFTIQQISANPGVPAYSTYPLIQWEKSPVSANADEILAAAPRQPGGPAPIERIAAETWLRDLLNAGPMDATDIHDQAKLAGLVFRTVQRAADHLNIQRRHGALVNQWTWSLPPPNV